ncbi:MAG: MaoC domain protein dehydratase [Nocardioides sp.]|nr:MaoC domain protein dehydratase [Nocardioides sp.]
MVSTGSTNEGTGSTNEGSTLRVVAGTPHPLPMMLRAALPAVPGVNLLPGIRKHGHELPDLALTRHDVPIDPAHVAAYAEVCGFPAKDVVPLTYPHLLAFPLHMAIMTDGSFPFPAIGTVHLENAITRHRPIAAAEVLQVTARATNLRPHAKGRVFDMFTTVHSLGELVWEETSTFLRRGKGDDSAASDTTYVEAPAGPITWRLPADLGRKYAAVSGDHNPIHLYPLTAKAFGFPRQIAHGMWSKARCIAAFENRLPDAVRVDVAFKKPILLPGTVAFGARPLDDGGYAFSLGNPTSGAPHVVGRTSAP